MKTPITLILGLIFSGMIHSQDYYPFPDSNAIWNIVGENNIQSNEFRSRFGIFGDTIINSTSYRKIYDLYDTNLIHENSTYFAAVRLENKKVFVKLQDFPETILYDFSLSIGDTIWYEIGGCAFSGGSYFDFQSHWKTVTSIDTVTVENGEQRKRWHLESEFLNDNWIEGIGSVMWYGLFNPFITDIILNGDIFYFACFKHNEQVIYLNNPFCDECFCHLYAEIEQTKLSGNKLSVIPNPAKDRIIIHCNENEKRATRLRIFNSLGITIFEKYVNSSDKLEIYIAELSKGFYTVMIFDKCDQVIGLNKFIKE